VFKIIFTIYVELQ